MAVCAVLQTMKHVSCSGCTIICIQCKAKSLGGLPSDLEIKGRIRDPRLPIMSAERGLSLVLSEALIVWCLFTESTQTSKVKI